ncbi:MAG: bifunctional folylpolyglutamate synthase/dihydrofolate synthase [Gammaproteobacteria bacterium]|nr:bifunctional folylpolyglutamate synthase/dihydrofolate synthase [Gammaproteobacteria bacterium]
MRFDSLDEWLNWQLSLHSQTIELGLERVSTVAKRLGIDKIATTVITVAGTNGKGSTVASYETWLHAAGYSVASYTSPHLLSYNERIKFDLQLVVDHDLCTAFEAIDQARDDIVLTYFEFGTLAAIWLIQQRQPDFAILEVGLGGRLDAVNIIDADLVHLTSIGIDHQNWLGNSREKIGFEKAGVLRKGIPVICNDAELPQSVQREITRLNCACQQYQREFSVQSIGQADKFIWQSGELTLELSQVLPGIHQRQNLAGVVAGLNRLLDLSGFDNSTIEKNFEGTELAGRFQKIQTRSAAEVYIDVGHNQDAARALAKNLSVIRKPQGRVVVLLGMLNDKDNAAFVAELTSVVDNWWLMTLDVDRGLDAASLAKRVSDQLNPDNRLDNANQALDHALLSLGNQDIMLVTGSFVTVEHFLLANSRGI